VGIKLKDDEQANFSNPLQRRPNLAALIGYIVSEFSTAEMVMAIAFTTLLKVDLPIGTDILDSIYGKNQKRNQIAAVARARLTDSALLGKVLKAVDNINDVGIQRDNVAHGKWSTCDAERFKDKLLWQRKTWGAKDGYEVYGEKELADLTNRIIESRNALQLLIPEIAKHLGTL
jgi:hypothetical protein